MFYPLDFPSVAPCDALKEAFSFLALTFVPKPRHREILTFATRAISTVTKSALQASFCLLYSQHFID